MSIARKLAVAGAAAAVVAGVCASPAAAAIDPDLQRLNDALSYPNAQAGVTNAVAFGNSINSATTKAHAAWVAQVAAYNKALAKYRVNLRNYNFWLPIFKAFHKKPPPPPKPPTAPPKTGPVVTAWAQFGRIGTVSAVTKVPKSHAVSVTVTGIELAFNGNSPTNDKSAVTFTFDDNSSLHSIVLRDTPTPKQPVHLSKTNEGDIKVKDKIGVIGTRWGPYAIGGLVVVKTL